MSLQGVAALASTSVVLAINCDVRFCARSSRQRNSLQVAPGTADKQVCRPYLSLLGVLARGFDGLELADTLLRDIQASLESSDGQARSRHAKKGLWLTFASVAFRRSAAFHTCNSSSALVLTRIASPNISTTNFSLWQGREKAVFVDPIEPVFSGRHLSEPVLSFRTLRSSAR